MGQTLSSFGTKKPAKKPSKDVKFLKKLETTLKKHPTISDEEWQKIATKSWKKMKKEQFNRNCLYEINYVPIIFTGL